MEGYAGLAHLVEQLICNHQVAGSSPAAGTKQAAGKAGPRNGTRFFLRSLVYAFAGTHSYRGDSDPFQSATTEAIKDAINIGMF
jgi:hypothetical protein